MSDNKILLVDDESIVRESLYQWLLMEGFHVVTAASGEDALQICKFERFAVGVFDIRMPGMDGITLLKNVRKHCPDMSVIMMTAYASIEDAIKCITEGAFDYITKPFPPEKLTNLLRYVIELIELRKKNESLQNQVSLIKDFLSNMDALFQNLSPTIQSTEQDYLQMQNKWKHLRTLLHENEIINISG